MAANSEMNQRPHKRTGVWSSDTVKQKIPEEVTKRYSRTDVIRINSVEDDNDGSHLPVQHDQKCTQSDVLRNAKVDLFKLPALSSWNEPNKALLFNQFNSADEVKEDDVPWTEDLLFAEITSKLSKDEFTNK